MVKKHEFIAKNISSIRRLIKSGDITGKLINDYNIYKVYMGYSSIKSKMERYQFTADDLRISQNTVIKAIKSMESVMR